jgi:hypothetical protein
MRRERLLTIMVVLLAVSCRDATAPTTSWTVPTGSRYQLGASGTLDGEITSLIAMLFPNGLETAAGTRWDGVRAKYAAGDVVGARKRVNELARWVKNKESQMEPPPMNESRAGAAARLILYMSLYVYNGPATQPPPEFGVGADATAQIITPTEPAVVQTAAMKAAARFDAGSVADEAIVVISQNTQFFQKKCSGPFTTKYCQYPLYYHYRVFPQQAFLKNVRTSICHVHRGPDDPYEPTKYQPLPGVDHDAFVTLHDLPADPKSYTPGGKQIREEQIEVLPHSTEPPPATPVVSCSGTAYGQVSLFDVPAAPSGVFGKAYAMATRAVNGAATAVGRALTPQNLYAVDNGEETFTRSFSNFANADSSGHPDLEVRGSSTSAASVAAGDPLTVTYTVGNVGTAHSPVVNTVVRLVPAAATDQPAVDLPPTLPTGSTSALYPEESRPGSATVTIPDDLAPGTYTITAAVSSAGGLTEIALGNNTNPVSLTVRARLAATAVRSELQLVASSQANDEEVKDDDGMTQSSATDPLRATVNALYDKEGTSVRAQASAVATWVDAANGQVVFTNLGWTVNSLAANTNNHATLYSGTDWLYTFTATRSGEFTLNYALKADNGTTSAFGLQGFGFTWSENGGEAFTEHLSLPNVELPPTAPAEWPATVGSLKRQVVAGHTYTVRLQNSANIFFGTASVTAHMSATFTWSVGPTPPPIG